MAFKKLFWGFIFLFDFRIGGFDILPDIVAYILFYQGLSILENRNDFFSKAKKFAFPMIFISIVSIYQVTVPITELGNTTFGFFGLVIGLVSTIINILMVYNICYGISNAAILINDSELESQAMFRWKLYLINSILIIGGILLPGLMSILFFIIIIFSLLSYILMLGLMNNAANKLDQ